VIHRRKLAIARWRTFVAAMALSLVAAGTASAAEGLITKPSGHSADETLARLEGALKERGLIIFTRLDHAAAAQSVGLKMPRSTVLVYGNPRVGTPRFVQHPTLAIEFPAKALVWEDADGKVWVSYNTSAWIKVLDSRHGAPSNPNPAQADAALDGVIDAATK
jgi:uncharacterized protein (DUF302 family)